MPGFATLSAPDLKRTINALASVDRAFLKEWKRKAKREVAEPWARLLSDQYPGDSRSRAAGASIKAGTGTLPIIWMGKGSWRGFQPWWGTEFGGRKGTLVTYINRQRSTRRRYVINRRTTMQFDEHLGRTGYFVFPYWRGHEKVLRGMVDDLASDFFEEYL